MSKKLKPMKSLDAAFESIGMPKPDYEGFDKQAAIAAAAESGGSLAERDSRAIITSCEKHGFPSEGAARKAIKNRLRKGSDTSYLRPYLCPHCGYWHMTSTRDYKKKA